MLHFKISFSICFLFSFSMLAQTEFTSSPLLDKRAISNIRQMTTGSASAHSFEIRNGKLYGWGWDAYGQLGDGDKTPNKTLPIQIGSDSNWVNVSVGNVHSLALKSDGTLWAWGRNNFGQLGDGSKTDHLFPVEIGFDNQWIKVIAGDDHSIAIKSDGTLWAWGLNSSGQLGDGTIVNKSTPILIGNDTDWIEISACDHTLGLKKNGTLWAWGDNFNGQLGDNTLTNRTTPVQIGTDQDWVSIAAGDNHSLAIKSDGTLWAWGDNFYGQLGNASIESQTVPIQSGLSTQWVSVVSGNFHSLALTSNGTIWAWGANDYGQTGVGSRRKKLSIPSQVGKENNWSAITAGDIHTVALKKDGSLWSWGRNNFGQLGDGTLDQRNVPVRVGVYIIDQ